MEGDLPPLPPLLDEGSDCADVEMDHGEIDREYNDRVKVRRKRRIHSGWNLDEAYQLTPVSGSMT